jgi:3-isopropylmalate/(R)-2-methylmalate dehydratase small subunit
MRAFVRHTGIAVPLDRANVDTDQIIPKEFLKRIERTGFGEFLFNDWRYHADGTPVVDFELNLPRYPGASILITRHNFGCGSSREHAVWALDQYGIRAVIAPSFADIFRNNALGNGLLPVVLGEEQVSELLRRATERTGYQLTVDLETQLVSDADGLVYPFTVAPFDRYRLLNGLDDIGLTLQHEEAISTYEARLTGAGSA